MQVKGKLSERDAALSTLVKNWKRRLKSKKEERNEEIRKAKEELDSANNALTELQQELQSEKELTQDLRAQIDHLQGVIAQDGDGERELEEELRQKQEAADILQQRMKQLSLEIKDKENTIEKFTLSLSGQELERTNLTSIYNQTKEDLAHANSAVQSMKEEVRKTREELELKKSLEEDLNTRIKLLVTEIDEIEKKVHDLRKGNNDFKSASAKREASDAELLSNKASELNQLKEKLNIASSNNQSLIADLSRERDSKICVIS